MSFHPRQSGQAMVFGIVALLFSVLVAIAVFNTGQTTSEKTRLVNAADAAVYSAAVWEARTLNFQAYANRAMVANQVAIAQVISFASWIQYLEQAAINADTAANVISWFPAIGLIVNLSSDYKDPRLAIAVEVAKDGGKVRTSRRIGVGAGRLSLDDHFNKKNELSALSKAEVYFKRPVDRGDGKEEYGNLFNPY